MKKAFFALVLSIAAIPSYAADDLGTAQFVDVQVQIINEGKQVYSALVLIPRNQEVVDDTFKTSTVVMTCSRGVTVSPPLVYEEGVRLSLSGTAWSNDTLVRVQYSVAAPKRDDEYSAFGERCNRLNVETKLHGGNSSAFLRTGESMNIKHEDVKINLILKGVYMVPPAGRVVGQFYRG
jgi:hypothetical protein